MLHDGYTHISYLPPFNSLEKHTITALAMFGHSYDGIGSMNDGWSLFIPSITPIVG